MIAKILPKHALQDWIETLRSQYRIIGPKPVQSQHIFGDIQSADDLDLSYLTSILPPKKVLLPQREDLFHFDAVGNIPIVKPMFDDEPTVILGIHACDMHSIELLDRVFTEGKTDQHYQTRRQNTTLVSLECLTSCSEFSFCKSMGTLSVPDNFDLHMTDLGDEYLLEIGTSKGASLLWGFNEVRETEDADFERLNKIMSEKWSHFKYRLDFDITELPALLSLSYGSKVWEELGDRCLGCGSCNIVCPTCYCFDVGDDVNFNLCSGSHFRLWDSCQLDRFAIVAGGHDFRDTRAARQRHRFFRKGKYLTNKFGVVGCVGCGRCAQACLVHISPVDTFNELHRRQVPSPTAHKETLA
ncbi:MAG: 4Fe-4S dicluster domain-containing protein [Anaerolineales bacterium]|nr:4Fe-4S dicluster domain-containing protein [Anaerolineales bacterium]